MLIIKKIPTSKQPLPSQLAFRARFMSFSSERASGNDPLKRMQKGPKTKPVKKEIMLARQ